jgi:hypothetical protein
MRAGERVLAIANFSRGFRVAAGVKLQGKLVSARRRNHHVRRVRYPEVSRLERYL